MKKSALKVLTIRGDGRLFLARPCDGETGEWCVEEIEFRIGKGAQWCSTFYEPVKPKAEMGMTRREALRKAKRMNEEIA